MRIVIDLQGAQCGSRHRGIGRYTISLAKAMVRQRGSNDILIALNGLFHETIEPICAEFADLLPVENIYVWHASGPVHAFDASNDWRRNAAEIQREAFLSSLNPDVVHITSLLEGFGDDAVHTVGLSPTKFKCVATFYDVIPLIQRDIYLTPNPHFEGPYTEKLDHLRKVEWLLAISESARQEAIEHLDVTPERIVSIGAAVNDDFRPIDVGPSDAEKLFKKFHINRPFLMYSGATDDRKNHLRLIEAYASLDPDIRAQYQLALVGGLPDDHRERFNAHVKKCGLTSNDVVITGRVTDVELVQFYNVCHLYVFPSWHEGFGLPALEAMSCGAPVIGSNTTSVPEVIGRDDALFDPFDEKSIAQKITEVVLNEEFRIELKRHGLERAKLFSWDRSAALTINSLEKWHGSSASPATDMDAAIDMDWIEWTIDRIAAISKPVEDQDLQKTARSIVQNNSASLRPESVQDLRQLFVDVSELVQRDGHSGIQRVCRSILLELMRDPPKGYVVEPVYGKTEVYGYKYARHFGVRFGGDPDDLHQPEPDIAFYPGDVFLGLDMQHQVIPAQSLFYQDLRRAGVKVAFVLYDLLPVLRREFFPKATFDDHERWLKTITQVDQVLCISETVSLELKHWLSLRPLGKMNAVEISWFRMGADFLSSVPTTGVPVNSKNVLKNLARRPTFLLVSTIEPRKGHRQTLDAFQQLWAQGIDVNLVFVGKEGWGMADLIKKMRMSREIDKRLFFLNGVSDEYLKMIYEASTCLIAASEGEGFGLPLIEAAHHAIPIIARDIAVFHEVAGQHAFYFRGNSPEHLTTAILQWLRLQKAAMHPESSMIQQLTWKDSTKSLLQQILPAADKSSGEPSVELI